MDIHLTCAEHVLSPNSHCERKRRHDPIRIPSTSALTVLTQGTVLRTQKCSHPATISTLLHHPNNRIWLENEPSHFCFRLQHLQCLYSTLCPFCFVFNTISFMSPVTTTTADLLNIPHKKIIIKPLLFPYE